MVLFFFALFVALSLGTSVALALDLIDGSPAVLGTVGGLHLVLLAILGVAYRRYQLLHRLVLHGQPELFDLGIQHRIQTTRSDGLRQHYLLRRVQGLVLGMRPERAIEAASTAQRHGLGPVDGGATAAAEAMANLALAASRPDRAESYVTWARLALDRIPTHKRLDNHPEVQAAQARLAHVTGSPQDAVATLSKLTGVRYFPLTAAIRARNWLWLGEAHAALDQPADAARAFDKAARAAPRSAPADVARRRLGAAAV